MRLRDSFSPRDLWRGARDNLGIGIAVSGYGAVFGVLTAGKGIALADMVAMNLFIFAGAAQFLIVEMWTPHAVVAEIILAALIINLRYLLVGASLRPVFTGRPLTHKALGMHLVADENWAVTMNRVARAGGPGSPTMPGRRTCWAAASALRPSGTPRVLWVTWQATSCPRPRFWGWTLPSRRSSWRWRLDYGKGAATCCRGLSPASPHGLQPSCCQASGSC